MPPSPAGSTVSGFQPEPGSPDDVCAREPISTPGSIQPHGVLLALDEDSRIVVASENTGVLLGRAAADLVGAPAADVMGVAGLATALSAVTPSDPDAVGGPLRLRLPAAVEHGVDAEALGTLAGAEVDVLVHRSTGLQVIELEPVLDALGAGAMSYRTARQALARITAAGSVAALCDILAGEIHELTGFDRVMVYRFDEEWNGEVVAERCRDDQEPYLGLRYPASDIPAQARALYVRNWTRLIADAEYTPSPLVPDRVPTSGLPMDLSRAALRSVSPIHLDYLANMGVRASMSLSIVIDGRLWGLVACHHNAPHRPSFDARSAAEFLAQVASSAIDERETADRREAELRSQQQVAELTDRIGHDDTALDLALVVAADDLRAVLGADCLALRVVIDDVPLVRVFGEPLDDGAAERFVDVLTRSAPGESLVAIDALAGLDPRLGGPYAGALYLELGDGRWLVALRHELTRTVDWGGEPTVKVVREPAREGEPAGYGPRESFARWQQVVRGRSAPWRSWELEAAASVRNFVDRTRVRRAKDQLFVAESLQRALVMPVAPTIPGVDLATRYDPSRSGILGGDWWDVVPTGRGRYALVVGDVSGHGLDAAATMAQIRTSLRTYLLDGTAPGEALDRLDRAVGALMRRTIATCAIVEIDPLASEAALLGAAHLSPVLVPGDPSQPVRALATATRPPLGVQVEAALQPTVVPLAPGDVVLVFSDGLVERRDRGIDETMTALVEFLEAHRGESGVLETWLAGVTDARIGDGSDDTTVVAARIRG